jgi:hypothetical protein
MRSPAGRLSVAPAPVPGSGSHVQIGSVPMRGCRRPQCDLATVRHVRRCVTPGAVAPGGRFGLTAQVARAWPARP